MIEGLKIKFIVITRNGSTSINKYVDNQQEGLSNFKAEDFDVLKEALLDKFSKVKEGTDEDTVYVIDSLAIDLNEVIAIEITRTSVATN